MSIRNGPDRETITVARHEGQWAVEHAGAYTDHSIDKDVAKAAANKRARAILDSGRLCQVKIAGEHGFRTESWAAAAGGGHDW